MSPVQDTRSPVGYSPQQVGYGIGRSTHVRTNSGPALISRYSTPLPLPPGASLRTAQSVAPVSEAPAPYVPMLPPKEKTPSPDGVRVQTLRREAKQRHEQELRDLEVARQLDRELNMT